MFQSLSWVALAAALTIAPDAEQALQQGSAGVGAVAEAPVAGPEVETVKLPALTTIELKILEEVTSKSAVPGAPVRLSLARPIYLGTDVGIAEGTTVEGVVIHAAKGGMGGKSGELLLGARRLILADGVSIPLRSFKLGPARGKNNETLAFATAAAVGLPALFITGGSARIPAGTVANAKISADTEIPVTLLSKLPLAVTASAPQAAHSVQPNSTRGETK